MIATPRQWDPDEWEAWINRLLKRRYGFHYQQVPATNRGDFGMEGFSTVDGCVFQCYAPKEPLTTERRYEKHRDKMTRDTEKFITNKQHLEQLFANGPVQKWILVVPLNEDKQLLVHAANRTTYVLQKQLTYVAPNFQIAVADESFFESEVAALSLLSPVPEPVASQIVAVDDVTDWFDSNQEYLSNLNRKTSALPMLRSPAALANFRLKLLENYARGMNAVRAYHEHYPDLADQIVKLKQERANSLAIECLLDDRPSNALLLDVFTKHMADLQGKVYGLSKTTAESLSWEAVVEWLFTCPLEFVAEESA